MSCFKIITCASDSVDHNDLEAAESKSSSDKRGWSFRKRSARHRVLSNTVISETPSSGNKESPETAVIISQAPENSAAPEKITVPPWPEEKPQLSTSVDSKVTETIAKENKHEIDIQIEESAVVIQAAIRGLLAQKALFKLKSVVKLQAAIRGHLVRKQAVGTLRCVQAIVKMQILVRARRARLALQEKSDGIHGIDNYASKPLERVNAAAKPNVPKTSMEKLLTNGFARQLLESTPKDKVIDIKCDSSKPNSAWNWLERWMSVFSPSVAETQIAELSEETQQRDGEVKNSNLQDAEKPSDSFPEPADLKSNLKETTDPCKVSEHFVSYDSDNLNLQTDNAGTSTEKEIPSQVESLPKETTHSDTKSLLEINSSGKDEQEISSLSGKDEQEISSLSGKDEQQTEESKRSTKGFSSEQSENDAKKSVFGSRKVSNPSFIAAHSKFEELSSTSNSGSKSITSCQDLRSELNVDRENSTPQNSKILNGSDSGTELSISSTLDSPDRSEVGAPEFESEPKIQPEKLNDEVKIFSVTSDSKFSNTITGQPEKFDDVNVEFVNPEVSVDPKELTLEPSDTKLEQDSEREYQNYAYKSSPEASPRSHITVPESQGTPASQISVNPKRVATEKSGSDKKRKSLSEGKRSPLNQNHDSGARISTEKLPRDQKNGKRRNSFGSPKLDNVDQESRERNGCGNSQPMPSYMQPTESARAKVHANNSPRSSPDVLDKEIYTKKRHSLPGANGRQGSPRIERSTSQQQHGTKGNDRKWQR